LIDPQRVEGSGFPNIKYNKQETSNIYLGALIVISIQSTMILLITNMMCDPENFELLPADSFAIIIPRFLASVMMHLNVEPDIRNGLNLMKYAVNHPSKFKH